MDSGEFMNEECSSNLCKDILNDSDEKQVEKTKNTLKSTSDDYKKKNSGDLLQKEYSSNCGQDTLKIRNVQFAEPPTSLFKMIWSKKD
jgi:hypothetical protein